MALESLPWGVGGDFAAMDVGGFGSFWGTHSNTDQYQYQYCSQGTEELKQKLLQTTLELETLRTATKDEIRKREENITKLIHLVKITTKERDEAREQLNALLSYLQSKKSSQQQQSAAAAAAAMNNSSGLTESDVSSSPVESFYHAESNSNVTTPAAAAAAVPTAKFDYDYESVVKNVTTTAVMPTAKFDYGSTVKFDYGAVVIDELAKKRALPEKGRLMHAVINAGPLLQTLMVAGPLPMWRNPPPTVQIQRQIALQPLDDDRFDRSGAKRLRHY